MGRRRLRSSRVAGTVGRTNSMNFMGGLLYQGSRLPARMGGVCSRPRARSRGGALSPPRPADPGLHVADAIALEADLHLVVLDLPVADGRDPAERPAPAWDHAALPVHDGPGLARGQAHLLLGPRTEQAANVLVRRLAGADLGQGLRWRRRAVVPAGPRG